VLGTGEVSLFDMTSVYSDFANEGMRVTPTLIEEISDKTGKTIYKHNVERQPVLQPEVAFLISSILSDNQARSEEFGNLLTISKTAAVKTGTSGDYRDALTIGYTPSIVVGVWVGNNDNKPMSQIAGSLGAAPIWKNMMEYLLKDKPNETFTPPPGVTQVTVCGFNGLPLRNQEATSSAKKEYFIQGTVPTKYCYIPKPTPSPSPDGSQTPPPPTPQIPDIKPEDSAPVIQSKIEESVKHMLKNQEKKDV
jgi:membrane peptidoglycan carboxypeptidase